MSACESIAGIRHPQRDLRARCFHPSGAASQFSREEIEQSIPARFEKIVSQYFDRIAVKTASETRTYGELEVMANRVAKTILRRQGNKSEPIGLLFGNGAQLSAAMVGVLKAGKFFILLDPALPKARIVSMLEDCQARLVISNRDSVSLAAEIDSDSCHVLDFESIDQTVLSEDINIALSPRTFACIVYTSGSTGQPKGVVWDHRDLLHRIMLRTNENHPGDQDRIALLPVGTANAVTNTFFGLLNGAQILPFDVQKEGLASMANWLRDEKISICPISSPLFRNFCATLSRQDSFPALRLIRLRSETVHKTDVDLYKRHFAPNCLFVTGLSTSETGQLTTYLINHDTEIIGSEVPVGYAVEDKQILLFDDAGKEVGFNKVGEIAVRSRYLSPGYWRRPKLAESKFKHDPQDDEIRLCLTGDLGLMLPDGCLIHKGRKDFRVKIRGYGVETGEVEKVLCRHPAIREAVVVIRQNRRNEGHLVAYFTSFSQLAPSASDLRRFLKTQLPDHMIPSAYVMLDALPLTRNGKVDRSALPPHTENRLELEKPFIAPQDALERQLTKIWEKLLEVKPIGIRDNFFELGGHSLLAMRLCAQIEQKLGNHLPSAAVFQTPTVEGLAGILRQKSGSSSCSMLALQPNGSKPPFFCVMGSADLAHQMIPDQPFYALQSPALDGRRVPLSKVEDTALNYIKEIRAVQPEGPYFLGGFSFGGKVAFEMAHQLLKQGQEVALLALLDPSRAFSSSSRLGAYSLRHLLSELAPSPRHLYKFILMAPKQKLTYLWNGLMWRRWGVESVIAIITKKIKMIACHFYLAVGSRLPPELQLIYFLERSGWAARQSVPQVYPGHLIVFPTEERSNYARSEWGRLAGRGVDIHVVPGNHSNVLKEPNVRVVAQKLRRCLSEAQAKANTDCGEFATLSSN